MESNALLVVLLFAALAVWFGVVAWLEVTATRLRASDDPGAGVAHAGRTARLGTRVVLPAAIVFAVVGALLIRTDAWSLEAFWWIGSCIGLWVVAVFASTSARGGLGARMVAAAAEEGDGAEDVLWRARQMSNLARGELLLLAVTIALLVLQPS